MPEHNQQGSAGDWQNYAVGAPYGPASGVPVVGSQNFASSATSGSSHLDAMLYGGGGQEAGSYPTSAAGTPPVVTSPASFDGRSGANGPPNLGKLQNVAQIFLKSHIDIVLNTQIKKSVIHILLILF